MDISSVLYGSADVKVPPRPDIHINEEEELAKPKPKPLREPRPIGVQDDDIEEKASTKGFHPAFDSEADQDLKSIQNKHQSYDLSGSVFLIAGNGRTLELPIPSNSENDPLNWSWWKTAGAIFAVGFYSFTALTAVQGVSLMLEGIQTDFPEEMQQPWHVETLITWPTLFQGVGCFLWVPLSLALGRRPVLLLAALVELLATLGATSAQKFHQLLGLNCVMGLCEGLSLSLAFLMMIDMTFIARRPMAIAGMWAVAGFFGTSCLSLVPFLSDYGKEWRLFYARWSILGSLALLTAYIWYPETYFKRPTVAFDGMILMQSATEKLTIYEDLEANSEIYRDLPSIDPKKPGLLRRLGLARAPSTSWTAMGRCYIQMLFCLVNPLLFWVLIASAFNNAGMIFIGATYAIILSAPPYDLSTSLVPIGNVSSGAGSLLSYFVAGYLLCQVLARLGRRNGGVREAEHYLFGYIAPVIFGGLSTLLYGLAVHNQWHYTMFYLAYGINGLSFVSFQIGNTMWVTEAFPRWAAPALAVVTGGCYLMSFTLSFALAPWIDAHGYLLVGIELTLLQAVGGLIVVPIAFWGKSARQRIHGRWANERSGALRPL
ncbi:MFS general substrate transporter [Bimuria novae-zelandiae CBS 107.79]|uniref:MFS general substrate transporter n=1 Tax=Bimuria novae-zelandiae CBS 107.79 TaxID=1447943 RepID=A0A6A5UX09_9PLEO|nr:MFS general substrate transporter [Bimuria novae-zelandiae CBS 107.79]